MKNVLDRICRENQNAFCSVIFSPENRAVYEIMWKNIVKPVLRQMTWRVRIACWISDVTNTRMECEILTVFPLQQ
jgi:hypothetical protein